MSEHRKEFYAALAKAQGEMSAAAKSTTNTFFKSKYSDISDVLRVVKGPLADNGIALMQPATMTPDGAFVIVQTILAKGDFSVKEETRLPVQKKDPQEIGKLITYARRYGLTSMLGVPQEDDDAEGNMGRGKWREKAEQQAEDWGNHTGGQIATTMKGGKTEKPKPSTLDQFKVRIDQLAREEGAIAVEEYWKRDDVQAALSKKPVKMRDEAQAYMENAIEAIIQDARQAAE